jgi:hypothetical protein
MTEEILMKLYYAETVNPRKVCAVDQARLPLDGFAEIERWYAQLAALPAWRDPFPLANRTA